MGKKAQKSPVHSLYPLEKYDPSLRPSGDLAFGFTHYSDYSPATKVAGLLQLQPGDIVYLLEKVVVLIIA